MECGGIGGGAGGPPLGHFLGRDAVAPPHTAPVARLPFALPRPDQPKPPNGHRAYSMSSTSNPPRWLGIGEESGCLRRRLQGSEVTKEGRSNDVPVIYLFSDILISTIPLNFV